MRADVTPNVKPNPSNDAARVLCKRAANSFPFGTNAGRIPTAARVGGLARRGAGRACALHTRKTGAPREALWLKL